MELLGVIWLAIGLAFARAENIVRLRPEDSYDKPPETFQCQDEFYEYDASTKGEVYSPFYKTRANYHDDLWCDYRIKAPKGYRIKLTFKDFDLVPADSCTQDKLIVLSKDKRHILGVFCGSQIPHPIMSLEGESEILLLLQTDYMASAKGFAIQYEASPNMKLCDAGRSPCKNRNCYDPAKKCDGVDDCGDGTDEEKCGFPLVTYPEKCGTAAIKPRSGMYSEDRIVGGEVAVPNSWPWQVSLQKRMSEPNAHFCGGTLINAQWVLTASHCVSSFSHPSGMRIHVGAHYKYNMTKYEQIRLAEMIIAYPNLQFEMLSKFSISHDVTLIKLNAPVKFNDGVQPACLPKPDWASLRTGSLCYATGWGATRGTGAPDQLKQTKQFVLSPSTCKINPRNQICVGLRNNSPCHGDSGGPLQGQIGGKWYIFGAASYVTTGNTLGGLCTGPGANTVYASVPAKLSWIKAVVNKFS